MFSCGFEWYDFSDVSTTLAAFHLVGFLAVSWFPHRLAVVKIERYLLLLWVSEVERRKRNAMVDLPFAHVLPRHSGLELRFQVRLELGHRTTNEF